MKKGKEQKLLEALRTQEPWGLEAAINRYAPYVAGVIKRVLGNLGTQEDLEELSSDVFVAGPEVYAATPPTERAQKTIDTLIHLRRRLADLTGLPTTLSQTGKVQPADFPAVARKALNDGAIIVNPAQADYDDVLALLKEVWA